MLAACLFVGQKGKGVPFDSTTTKPTYMLSAQAGTGPGVGKQRFYQVNLEGFALQANWGGTAYSVDQTL